MTDKKEEWIVEKKHHSEDEEIFLFVIRFAKRHYEFFLGLLLGCIILTLALT